MLRDDHKATRPPERFDRFKKLAGTMLGLAFVVPFLLWILVVPGVTERHDAAEAGYCSVVNHGHHYLVSCNQWRIAYFCERWLLVYALVLLVTSALNAMGRMVRQVVRTSRRA